MSRKKLTYDRIQFDKLRINELRVITKNYPELSNEIGSEIMLLLKKLKAKDLSDPIISFTELTWSVERIMLRAKDEFGG